MRKTATTIIAALAAMFMATSCGGNSTGGDKESITFDSITADSTLWLTGDTTGPRCRISLNLKYATGRNADRINDTIIRSGILSPDYFALTAQKLTIEEAADSFVSRYVTEYKREYGELYRAVGSSGASFNCEYDVKTYIIDDNDKYLTYMADVYYYGGGAHGCSVVIARNIDVETGNIVSLKDIFVPGYEEELNDLIVKALCEKFDAKDINGLQEQSIFYGIDPYAPDNFIIADDGITFIYSSDEIACHAVGEIRVELKNDELKRLFRK